MDLQGQRDRNVFQALGREDFYLRHRVLLTVLMFVAAAAVRLAFLLEYRARFHFGILRSDAQAYDTKAWIIASGDWIGDTIFYQDPLYPYFVAVFYKLFGHVSTAPVLGQIFLGALSALCAVALAHTLFRWHAHREKIAWLAGGLYAICMPLVFYDGLLLKVSLGCFLTIAHLALLVRVGHAAGRRNVALAVSAGILLGLNLLIRGNYILLAPFFGLVLLYRVAVGGAPGRRAAAFALGGYVAGSLLVVAPVTVRNYAVGNEFVLITSQGGQNFWIGNNPDNDGGTYTPLEGVRPTPLFEETDMRALAEAETGRAMRATEVSSHYYGKALTWIRENPKDAAALLGLKISVWFMPQEIPDNYSFAFLRSEIFTLKLPLASTRVLLVFGWLGLVLLLAEWRRIPRDQRRNVVLFAGFVLIYSASVIAFFVTSRYRAVVYPALLVLAAFSVVWLVADFRKAGAARRAVAVGALLVLGVLALRPIPREYRWQDIDLQRSIGDQAATLGDLPTAIGYWEDVVKNPRTKGETVLSTAWRLHEHGQSEVAVAALRDNAARFPDAHLPQLVLASLLNDIGRYAEAEVHAKNALNLEDRDSDCHLNLGYAWQGQGEGDQARMAYFHSMSLELQYPALNFGDKRAPQFTKRYRAALAALLASGVPQERVMALQVLDRMLASERPEPWIREIEIPGASADLPWSRRLRERFQSDGVPLSESAARNLEAMD